MSETLKPVLFILLLTTMSPREGHCFQNQDRFLDIDTEGYLVESSKPNLSMSELEAVVDEITKITADYIKRAQHISQLPLTERMIIGRIFEEIFKVDPKVDFNNMEKIKHQLIDDFGSSAGEAFFNRVYQLINCINELPQTIHCIIYGCDEPTPSMSMSSWCPGINNNEKKIRIRHRGI